jgi:hypothetical protein
MIDKKCFTKVVNKKQIRSKTSRLQLIYMGTNIQIIRVVKEHPHEKWKVQARGLPYK